ncbi:uncharacterized protein nsl1 [Chelonus insularis]|uniref:uncharacterized protein nsl1 n=1 Tax=Chelonus insularis TaxID=460826 RepID=UPI0015888D91|nr:uncharacterized protein LOC118067828 [Chelonus insularis]
MGVSTAPEQHRRGRRCRWEPLDVEAVAPAASVAVMAPALTEGGPQKPDDLLTPLPASGFLSPEQAAQVCQNREVLAKFVVSANVQPTKIDEQCLRGISKELIRDVINSKYSNGLDSLSMFANGSDLITRERKNHNDEAKELDYEEEALVEEDFRTEECPVMPDSSEPESSDIIMSEPSSNAQNDEMGFLKASEDVPMGGVSLPTDKDLARIMEFNPELPTNVGDIGNVVGDIVGQNVEDILQVISSIEGGETPMVTGDAILPSGSTESGVTPGVEMFPMSESFSSFERDLLNDVNDVMNLVNENINMNENMGESSEAQRDINLRIQQESVEEKHFEVERRCAFLLRRLRKLQTRIIGRHIAEENTGVLELAHHSVKKYFLQELSNISPKGTTPKNFPEIGGTLDAFLQKIEKSCVAQSNSVNRQRVCCRYFGGGSRDNALGGSSSSSSGSNTTRHPLFGTAQVKIDGEEVENVAGSLATQLHTVESNLDSDCTASSSGGESCDEMQTFNNPHQQQLPISKRAAWRYAQDRAGVAARWMWLQAQISDLEYKIRQHNDLQCYTRANKGCVVLDNPETVNGYSGVLPGSTGRYNSLENEPSASRTRPFVSEVYKKRKLLRVEGLHEVSKRAARASTIRCDCDRTLASCALCTGRTDPMQPQEPLDQLSIPERIALVDPCYHPVLSFPDEVTHSTHFDAIMKSVDWQQKMLRGSVRMSRVKDNKEPIERRKQQNKLPEHKTKYTTKIKKSSSSLLTARIKRKMLKGKRLILAPGKHLQGLNKKRVNKVSQQAEDDEDVSAQSSSSKHSSPVPSPLQQPTTTEKVLPKEKSSNSHIRLRQNSYDIDNIVIPYSVAASTRLEKLQYKEILTPKWRLCEESTKADVKNGVMHRPSQDSDVEDVSDEAVALRHERSEREEYKRFMTYVNMVPQSRIRHNRRADSRADSGANTPDPMSPHPSDISGDVTSPITSPPATPMSHDTDHHNTLDNSHRNSIHYAIRRRTISSNKIKEEMNNSIAEEEKNEVLPYQARTFPLSEEVYDKMLEVMPDGHWQSTTSTLCSRITDKVVEEETALDSPESDTTESAYCDADGEDPNDPEWTVGDDRDAEKERIRLTAKR